MFAIAHLQQQKKDILLNLQANFMFVCSPLNFKVLQIYLHTQLIEMKTPSAQEDMKWLLTLQSNEAAQKIQS